MKIVVHLLAIGILTSCSTLYKPRSSEKFFGKWKLQKMICSNLILTSSIDQQIIIDSNSITHRASQGNCGLATTFPYRYQNDVLESYTEGETVCEKNACPSIVTLSIGARIVDRISFSCPGPDTKAPPDMQFKLKDNTLVQFDRSDKNDNEDACRLIYIPVK